RRAPVAGPAGSDLRDPGRERRDREALHGRGVPRLDGVEGGPERALAVQRGYVLGAIDRAVLLNQGVGHVGARVELPDEGRDDLVVLADDGVHLDARGPGGTVGVDLPGDVRVVDLLGQPRRGVLDAAVHVRPEDRD